MAEKVVKPPAGARSFAPGAGHTARWPATRFLINLPRMKVRDSGMPEQAYWESLFDVTAILDALRVDRTLNDVIEIGCGYGTFSVPVAQRIGGWLHTFDIEPSMVALTRDRLARAGVANVSVHHCDVLVDGTGLPAGSVDAVLLFNILHAEDPVGMLRSSTGWLREGGRLMAIHWRSDVKTPRGPALSIRPTPEQIAGWAAETGQLELERPAEIVPPWHFAVSFRRG